MFIRLGTKRVAYRQKRMQHWLEMLDQMQLEMLQMTKQTGEPSISEAELIALLQTRFHGGYCLAERLGPNRAATPGIIQMPTGSTPSTSGI